MSYLCAIKTMTPCMVEMNNAKNIIRMLNKLSFLLNAKYSKKAKFIFAKTLNRRTFVCFESFVFYPKLNYYSVSNHTIRIRIRDSKYSIYNSIDSPSLVIFQKDMFLSSVNSFMRQEDSKPLTTKCMGTNKPTLKRSMNCRPPSV